MSLQHRQKWVDEVDNFFNYRAALLRMWNGKSSELNSLPMCMGNKELLNRECQQSTLFALAENAKQHFDCILKDRLSSSVIVKSFDRYENWDLWLCGEDEMEHSSVFSSESEESTKDIVDDDTLLQSNHLILIPLKSKDSTLKKAVQEYGSAQMFHKVLDIVRASVICSSEESLLNILNILLDGSSLQFPLDKNSFSVVRVKNRFLMENFSGYRDILITIRVDLQVEDITASVSNDVDGNSSSVEALGDQIIPFYCELQLHLASLKLYESRTCGNIWFPLYLQYRWYFNQVKAIVNKSGSKPKKRHRRGHGHGSSSSDHLPPSRPSTREGGEGTDLLSHEDLPSATAANNTAKRFFAFKLDAVDMSDVIDAWEDRFFVLKKPTQVVGDVKELEDLVVSYLGGVGVRSKDMSRLKCYRDLFVFTDEHELFANVQEYIIKYLREDYEKTRGDMSEIGDSALLADTATEISRLATHFKFCKRYSEALPLSLEALELCERMYGKEHEVTAKELCALGVLLFSQGKFADSTKVFARSFEIRHNRLGDFHLSTLQSLSHYADALYQTNQLDSAIEKYNILLERQIFVSGNDSPDAATTQTKVGQIWTDKNNLLLAKECHLQALQKRIAFYGDFHLVTAESLTSIAYLLDQQGLYYDSYNHHQRALDIRRKLLGDDDIVTSESYHAVAELLLVCAQKREYYTALEYLERSLLIRIRYCNLDISEIALPSVLTERLRHISAMDNVSKNKSQNYDILIANSLQVYSELLLEVGKMEDAKLAVELAFSIRRNRFGLKSAPSWQSQNTLAVILQAQKRGENIVRLPQLDLLANDCNSKLQDATELRDNGKFGASMRMLQEIEAKLIKSYGEFHAMLAVIYNDIGMCLEDMESYPDAEKYFLKSLKVSKQSFNPFVEGEGIAAPVSATKSKEERKMMRTRSKNNDVGKSPAAMLSKSMLHSAISVGLFNLGNICLLQSKYARALVYFTECFGLSNKIISVEEEGSLNVPSAEGFLIYSTKSSFFLKCNNAKLIRIQYCIAQCFFGLKNIDHGIKMIDFVLDGLLDCLIEKQKLAFLHHMKTVDPSCNPEDSFVPEINICKIDPEYTAALNLKVLLLLENDSWEDALSLAIEAKGLREDLCGVTHPAYSVTLNTLGVVHYTRRDLEKAGYIFDNVLDIRERQLGYASRSTILLLNNLLSLFIEQGNSEVDVNEIRDKIEKIRLCMMSIKSQARPN